MGTDRLNSQSGKKKGDMWQGGTRNSVLGASSAEESPTAHYTATSFQSDQQYPATAGDPVVNKSNNTRPVAPAHGGIRQEQLDATETPAEEIEEERAKKQQGK